MIYQPWPGVEAVGASGCHWHALYRSLKQMQLECDPKFEIRLRWTTGTTVDALLSLLLALASLCAERVWVGMCPITVPYPRVDEGEQGAAAFSPVRIQLPDGWEQSVMLLLHLCGVEPCTPGRWEWHRLCDPQTPATIPRSPLPGTGIPQPGGGGLWNCSICLKRCKHATHPPRP